jgi:hypothetical protein
VDEPKTPRGWLSLYAAAFALMIAAGALLATAALDKLSDGSLVLLRISWWLSGAAIVLAVASVVLPRRR